MITFTEQISSNRLQSRNFLVQLSFRLSVMLCCICMLFLNHVPKNIPAIDCLLMHVKSNPAHLVHFSAQYACPHLLISWCCGVHLLRTHLGISVLKLPPLMCFFLLFLANFKNMNRGTKEDWLVGTVSILKNWENPHILGALVICSSLCWGKKWLEVVSA